MLTTDIQKEETKMIIATTTADPAVGFVMLAIIFAFSVAIYFVPFFIGCMRQKAEGLAFVLMINLFLGWSVIGWFVALVLALTGKTMPEVKLEKKQHAELLAAMAARQVPPPLPTLAS